MSTLIYPSIETVFIVPTGHPPHRQKDLSLIAPAHRLAMARLAVANAPSLEVMDIEARTDNVCYTAETLQRLHGLNPADEIFLIIGEDAYRSISTWKHAVWFERYIHFLVAARSHQAGSIKDIPPPLSGFKSTWLEMPLHPASATAIRQALHAGNTLPDGWLHPDVLAYIQSHHLYQS